MSLNLHSLMLLTAAMLLFVSCRDSELKRMPDTLPDIRGNITQLSSTQHNGKDDAFAISVKAKNEKDIRVTEAIIIVTEETKIEDGAGKDLPISALKQGQEVDVWFGDKLMESFPVQANAIAIRITSQE